MVNETMIKQPSEQTPSQSSPAEHQEGKKILRQVPKELVQEIFGEMEALFGRHFADMYGGTDLANVIEVWQRRLIGYTGRELKRGYDGLIKKKFPPTLPEFVEMCRPAIEPQEAFREAVTQLERRAFGNDTWSSPVIFWAAVDIGTHDMKSLSYPAIERRWKAKLEQYAEKLDPIPPFLVRLPEPVKSKIPPDEVHRRVAELAKTLNWTLKGGGK